MTKENTSLAQTGLSGDSAGATPYVQYHVPFASVRNGL